MRSAPFNSPRVGVINKVLIYCRQDSSLAASLTQSPVVPGSNPTAADVFPWCTHIHPYTVQIRGMSQHNYYGC